VDAILALGGAVPRIVARHILPNVLSTLVVIATLQLARAIVLEATLSFLGLGIQPPTPSWGGMIQEGREYLDSAWWISIFPGCLLARAIRRDPRLTRLPFIFYSSVFIGGPARDLGRDVGATAYLDAKDITPQQMARELESLVDRHVRAEYQETLGRLLDDVDFARRYHQVVIDTLSGAGREDMRDLVAESARALDNVLSRLADERHAFAQNTERTVETAQLALLKELGEYLGDRINNPLAVIMASAQLLEMRAPGNATTEAA